MLRVRPLRGEPFGVSGQYLSPSFASPVPRLVASVTQVYPHVSGMASPVYFFDHTWPEGTLGDTASKCNDNEAKFAGHLARYLHQNGYVGR